MKIGFFDSGIGGLTILSKVRETLPQYDYEYFGDTANLPYGDKTEAEILTLTKRAVLHLFEQGALLVIIACNTASAESLRTLQETILIGPYRDHRILGVIIPTVETVFERNLKRVLVIGTNRTIQSHKYNREFKKLTRMMPVTVVSEATPALVPLIEAGDITQADYILKSAIDRWVGEVDGVILGCTHYTLLKDSIRHMYGKTLEVVAQDEIIPKKLSAYLERHTEIESRLTRRGSLLMTLSGERTHYEEMLKRLNVSL